jgi:hypothetical protein
MIGQTHRQTLPKPYFDQFRHVRHTPHNQTTTIARLEALVSPSEHARLRPSISASAQKSPHRNDEGDLPEESPDLEGIRPTNR